MKNNSITVMTFLLLTLSGLTAAGPLLADVTATEEYTFTLDEGGRISVENINGAITIEGRTGNEVTVVATKKAGTQKYLDGIKVDIDTSASQLRIETRHPSNSGGWFGKDTSGSVSYRLTVPAGAELDEIETVNGELDIRGMTGAVNASTVNGGIELAGLQSDADLETVNGVIKAGFARLGAGQRVTADTVNGRIELLLPADASATVRAETLNGKIDADDFGLKPVKGFIGRDLTGELGDGGATITLETVNGSIRIKRQ